VERRDQHILGTPRGSGSPAEDAADEYTFPPEPPTPPDGRDRTTAAHPRDERPSYGVFGEEGGGGRGDRHAQSDRSEAPDRHRRIARNLHEH
jgi:hypothetical protein